MPDFITINKTHIAKGETINLNINIAKLPTRTEVDLPIKVQRAAKDGPVLLLLAGMHGDEINGIEIIRRLQNDKRYKLVHGTVITVPIVNIYGFIHLKRETPDGKDVNRCFPGNENGSLGSRIAYNVMKHILPPIDFGVDFHTGGERRTNYPQIRCTFKDLNNLELGKAFAAPFLLDAPTRDKTIRKEALKRKKPIIVFEGGESLRFDEFAIKEGVEGSLRLLKYLGMINSHHIEEAESKIINDSTWIRARQSGLFLPKVQYGEEVKKGQLIGNIVEPYSDSSIKINSTHNGYIIGMNNLPVVNQGEALFNIGFE